MTMNGQCEICKGVATNYISQLRIWRCDEHGIKTHVNEEAMAKLKSILEDEERMMRKNKPIKNPKSPFGKRYF